MEDQYSDFPTSQYKPKEPTYPQPTPTSPISEPTPSVETQNEKKDVNPEYIKTKDDETAEDVIKKSRVASVLITLLLLFVIGGAIALVILMMPGINVIPVFT